jgi:hypothetical protein
VWFDSSKQGKILFPHWRMLWEYIASIHLVRLSLYEQIRCSISLHQQLKGNEVFLLKDLLMAFQKIWQLWHDTPLPKTEVETRLIASVQE